MTTSSTYTNQTPRTEPNRQQDAVTQNIPNKRPLKKADKAQKSPSAFRTISEVADEMGVQQHVLRFWESKFSQIKPLKRGGGRRYYRPEDVALITQIHKLLYTEGYTIKGVQKLLSATRGNLANREAPVISASAAPQESIPSSDSSNQAATVTLENSPAPQKRSSNAVAKHRKELEAMLEELKAMRRMIES